MSARVRTGLGAMVLALTSIVVTTAPVGAAGTSPTEASAPVVESPAAAAPTASTAPPVTEAPPATEAPPTTAAPPVTEAPPAVEDTVVDDVVEEEVVEEPVEEPVSGDEVLEDEVLEDEVLEDEAEPAGPERVTATTQLDFSQTDELDRGTSSSLVTVVEPQEPTETTDTNNVVRLIMALLVVVGLLIATLTVRYWWYTNPARGLAPSRVVLPAGTEWGPPPETPHVAVAAGAAVPGQYEAGYEDEGGRGFHDAQYVGAASGGPFVETSPFVEAGEYEGLVHHPQPIGEGEPVVRGQLVGTAPAEIGRVAEVASRNRREFVDYGSELDAHLDAQADAHLDGPADAQTDARVREDAVGERTAEVPAVVPERRQAGLWRGDGGGEPMHRRLLEDAGGAGGGSGRRNGEAAPTVAAADVLSWADTPGAPGEPSVRD